MILSLSLQSLEFIRSSLNSLDVAAEFECARGLFITMIYCLEMLDFCAFAQTTIVFETQAKYKK